MKTASGEPQTTVQPLPAQPPTVSTVDGSPPVTSPTGQVGWMRMTLNALVRICWMRARLEAAVRAQFGSGQPGWSEFAVARLVLADADRSREMGPSESPALVLYRTAANLMMQSRMARDGLGLETDCSAAACWEKFRSTSAGARILAMLQQAQLECMVASIGKAGTACIVGSSRKQRRQAVTAMAMFAHAVASPLEKDAKAIHSVFAQRWLRVGLPALAVLVAAIVVANRTLPRTNLALHKEVTAVVLDPTHTPNPSALVDGNRTNLEFYATAATLPYATIDLGQVQRVSRVVVYNRSDCCKERAVPLSVEISQDLTSFYPAGYRETPFSRWSVDFPMSDVRYVRLTLAKPAGTLQLSEVEVY